jgi:hemoglobin
MEAIEEAGLPDDKPFTRQCDRTSNSEPRVAQQNSWAETEADLHPIREVPSWSWEEPPGP